MNRKHPRTPVVVTGVIAALLSVSGCADSAGYTVPKRICGAETPSDQLERLLPNGEKFAAEEEVFDDAHKRCTVTVDGKTVLYINEYRRQDHFDALQHAMKTRRERNPERVSGTENAVIADGEFIAVTRCGDGVDGSNVLEVALVKPRSEAGNKRDELESFAVSYLSATPDESGCSG